MTQKTPNPLEIYERSYCDCQKCTVACKTMPGNLAPGDFEAIAQYCGAQPGARFLEQNFRASDGPIVRIMHHDGTTEDVQIPTIVPAQEEDGPEAGRCVFLGEDDHCMIHPVAPFGCRMFKVCEGSTQEDDEKSAAALNLIMKRPVYHAAWKHLVERGLIAKPIQERRSDFAKALEEMESDHEQPG